MRQIWLLLLATRSACACFCISSGSQCSEMRGSAVVFVGRVLIDSGEGMGSRAARVEIEEALQNLPDDLREVDLDTSAGTSCHYRLKIGERYAIFAYSREGDPASLHIGACSNTFNLRGKEHMLDALRNQSKGGPSRLAGTVMRSTGPYSREAGVRGASVIVESDGVRQEVFTDGFGRYEFHGLAPSRYKIDVSRDGFVADSDFNNRWPGLMTLNPNTNTYEPDNSESGSVLISKNFCAIWDLAMWPNGKISGTVMGTDRQLLSGIKVQAFSVDDDGRQKSSPLRSAISGTQGVYTLAPLPEGDYVIGVNTESSKDQGQRSVCSDVLFDR